MTEVFDGHNDALGKLQADDGAPAGFLTGLPGRDIDLPRARAGGLAGGLFAINAPSPHDPSGGGSLWDMPYSEPIDHAQATAFTAGAVGRAHALAAASDGAVAVVTDAAALDRCRADGTLALVLHLEGAEAIDPGLSALDAWHAAGVRSLGPVWSRPNAFGHGVPFRFPASPDTGPGLTEAGLALVRRCARAGDRGRRQPPQRRGLLRTSRGSQQAPSSRRTARAMRCRPPRATSPTTSCARSAAATASWGSSSRRPSYASDGADDADTPLAVLVAHVRHAVALAGIDHVGLGSDFDGAPMPAAIGDVAGLPRLLDALRDDGFTADEVQRIAAGNWRRVLGSVWG